MTQENGSGCELLTSEEAAALLRINPKTLQRMVREGKVPAIKIGKLWRFHKTALDEWLRENVTSDHHPCRK